MTTSSNYAYASLDDIVFEGRNREYGAYLLRKLYTRNLWRGLVTGIALFLVFLSLPLIINKIWAEPEIITTIDPPYVPIEPIAITEPKPELARPIGQKPKDLSNPATGATRKILTPVVTPNGSDVLDTNLPTGMQPGTSDNPGNGGTTAIDGPGTGTLPAVEALPEKIWEFVEISPSFPGGEAAMLKYLGSHIRYPSVAERNKLEGLVVVQFVVNEAGAISDMVILKRLGGGTDEEALRVIKNMPNWQPGKQNGRPVKVRFTLPLRFTINKS